MSRSSAPSDVNALALRLLAFVLVAGAAVAGAMAFAMTRLSKVTREGAILYVLPGTGGRRFIDPTAVTVLGGAGLLMLGLGLVAVMLTRRSMIGKPPTFAPPVARPDTHRRRRALAILVIGVAMLASALGWRWVRTIDPNASPMSLSEKPRP